MAQVALMSITHPLTEFRKNHEPPLTQAALAEILGVDRGTVTRWELGTRKIDDALLLIVSERTGIPARNLRPDLAYIFKD